MATRLDTPVVRDGASGAYGAPAGSDRLSVFVFWGRRSGASAPAAITSVNWNGSTLGTSYRVTSTFYQGGGSRLLIELWAIPDAQVQASGTVTPTWDQTLFDRGFVAATYSGVGALNDTATANPNRIGSSTPVDLVLDHTTDGLIVAGALAAAGDAFVDWTNATELTDFDTASATQMQVSTAEFLPTTDATRTVSASNTSSVWAVLGASWDSPETAQEETATAPTIGADIGVIAPTATPTGSATASPGIVGVDDGIILATATSTATATTTAPVVGLDVGTIAPTATGTATATANAPIIGSDIGTVAATTTETATATATAPIVGIDAGVISAETAATGTATATPGPIGIEAGIIPADATDAPTASADTPTVGIDISIIPATATATGAATAIPDLLGIDTGTIASTATPTAIAALSAPIVGIEAGIIPATATPQTTTPTVTPDPVGLDVGVIRGTATATITATRTAGIVGIDIGLLLATAGISTGTPPVNVRATLSRRAIATTTITSRPLGTVTIRRR